MLNFHSSAHTPQSLQFVGVPTLTQRLKQPELGHFTSQLNPNLSSLHVLVRTRLFSSHDTLHSPCN